MINIQKFKELYNSNKQNSAVATSIAKFGINDASFNNEIIREHNHIFSNTTAKGKITSQKASGRCWMFAALNTMRIDTMKKYNLDTIEFSQSYTLFLDKIERSNYFLDCVIDTLDQSIQDREFMHILKDPLGDGGQWDMFKGIIKKYGIVPKNHMPETFHSSNTIVMNQILTSMLRFFAYEFREEYNKSKDINIIKSMKEDRLYKIYNVLVKCLGELPNEVNFEYYDKDKKYHKLPKMTPKEFFDEVISWNLDDKISLINSPTKDKPYGKTYTVKYLASVSEAEPIKYLNVPMHVLKNAAIKSILAGEPVWFGCDVGKFSERQYGIMDLDTYKYDLTLNYDLKWTKELRLDYGESLLTHAMVFTGINLDDNNNVINWQVENSWGKDVGNEGMFSMSDEWFDTFVYQIMIDKKYVEKEWVDLFGKEIVELAPWDPMGALAL